MTATEEPIRLSMNENRLGRYHLAFEMATGGMATVFLAKAYAKGGFEKLVALKTIHPHLGKQEAFVQMFLDEARIASRISHPNVCPVFDFGETDGTYFLAMEYLLGESLDTVFHRLAHDPEERSNPRVPALVARVIADACEGLHAAHELRDSDGSSLNVIHRDVSPQNLFLTYDGGVRVVDFGIASAADRLHRTMSGSVKGTAAYMSPEQARGKDLDRRTDIWALGVVLWEMLTGERLFRKATSLETMFAAASQPVPAPSEVRPDISPEIDEIVMRALSRDVDVRYPTARELGRDLTRAARTLGDPVGLYDLAEWMEQLFPVEKRKKQKMVSSVTAEMVALNDGETKQSSEVSITGIEELPGGERPSAAETQAAPIATSSPRRPMNSLPTSPTVEELSERRKLRMSNGQKLLYSIAALVVVGSIAGGWYLAMHDSNPAPTPVAQHPLVEPPVTSETPPVVMTPEPPPLGEDVPEPEPPPTRETAPSEDPEPPPVEPTLNPDATPEPVGRGYLAISVVDSWGRVMVDGRNVGNAPGRFSVSAGPHTIVVVPPDGPPFRRSVTVRANRTTAVSFNR